MKSYKKIFYNILVSEKFSFLNIFNIFQIYFFNKIAILYISRKYLISKNYNN
jgi:hypothetical protein